MFQSIQVVQKLCRNCFVVLGINPPVKVTITHIEGLSHLFSCNFNCTLGSRTSLPIFSFQFKVFVSLILGFYHSIIYTCYCLYYIICHAVFKFSCCNHVISDYNYILLNLSESSVWGPLLPTRLGRNDRRGIVIKFCFGFSFQLYILLFWHESEEKTRVLADSARVWGRNQIVKTRHQS